jgi:uncharacterized protein
VRRSGGNIGLYLGLATIFEAVTCLPLIALLAHVQRFKFTDYCHLDRLRLGPTLLCLPLMAGLTYGMELACRLLGGTTGSTFGHELFLSAGSVLLLGITLVIVGPLLEEVFWRGFVFKGISESKAGPIVAIGLTSVLWALQHTQYDSWGVARIAGMGVFLGIVRHITKSTTLTIFLHGAYNLYVFAAILLGEMGIALP